jgi:hypothetical protein
MPEGELPIAQRPHKLGVGQALKMASERLRVHAGEDPKAL